MQNKILISAKQGKIEDSIKLYNFLKSYSQQNRKFPAFPEISKILELKDYQIIELLRLLEREGKITRNVSHYYLPGMKEKQKIITKVSTPKKKYALKPVKLKILFIKTIFFLVGIIATVMSIYYSMLWFQNMMDWTKSLWLSICLISFSISAFETIILFKNNKQTLLVITFSVLWIIVLLFSMLSTIAGLINLQRQKETIEKVINISNSNDIILYNEYKNKINDIKIDIDSKRIERDKLNKFISKINDFQDIEQNKIYKNLNYRIHLKNQQLIGLKKESNDIQIKKEKLLENDIQLNIEKKKNFFEWLGELFQIDKLVFQFILSLFPAIFIDLIAPLSFAVALFYEDKKLNVPID